MSFSKLDLFGLRWEARPIFAPIARPADERE